MSPRKNVTVADSNYSSRRRELSIAFETAGEDASLPLYGRRGIVGWTIVDAADFDILNQHRWFADDKGYARRHELDEGAYRAIFLAREVVGLSRGDRRTVDHINRNPLDNRRANLRVITAAQNQQNRDAHRGSSSRFRGVSWDKDKRRWRASVGVDGTMHRLGYFRDELDAALAAFLAARPRTYGARAFKRRSAPDPVKVRGAASGIWCGAPG